MKKKKKQQQQQKIAASPNKNCEWKFLFIHSVFIFTQKFPSFCDYLVY